MGIAHSESLCLDGVDENRGQDDECISSNNQTRGARIYCWRNDLVRSQSQVLLIQFAEIVQLGDDQSRTAL